MTKIAIGSDHAGFELKEVLISYLKTKNTEGFPKNLSETKLSKLFKPQSRTSSSTCFRTHLFERKKTSVQKLSHVTLWR